MTLDELLTLVQNEDSEAFYKNVEPYLKTLDPETFEKVPSKTLLMHLASLLKTEKIAFVLETARRIWIKETVVQQAGEFQLEVTEINRTRYFNYLDAVDENGNNALIFAARANCLSAVKLLVESGVNTYQENCYSRTALTEAALNLNPEMIRFIMLRKPIPERDSWVPWHLKRANTYSVMTKREKMGTDALIYCARGGHDKAIELLLTYVPVDTHNILHDTPLIIAAGNNRTKTIELLLKHKADVNAKGFREDTALFHALCSEHHEATAFLIAQGADITPVWETVKWQPFITECLKKAGRPVPPPALCEASNNNLETKPTLVQTENENNTIKKEPSAKKQHHA